MASRASHSSAATWLSVGYCAAKPSREVEANTFEPVSSFLAFSVSREVTSHTVAHFHSQAKCRMYSGKSLVSVDTTVWFRLDICRFLMQPDCYCRSFCWRRPL